MRASRGGSRHRHKSAYRGAARAARPPVTSTSICDHCPHQRVGHRVRTGHGECKTQDCPCPGFSYELYPQVDRKVVAYRHLTDEEVMQGKALLDAGLTYHEAARKMGNMNWESSLRRRFPGYARGRPKMWDTQVLGEQPDQEGGDGGE